MHQPVLYIYITTLLTTLLTVVLAQLNHTSYHRNPWGSLQNSQRVVTDSASMMEETMVTGTVVPSTVTTAAETSETQRSQSKTMEAAGGVLVWKNQVLM